MPRDGAARMCKDDSPDFDRSPDNDSAERRSRRYAVIRTCIPNARVIRITVAKLGLPFSDNAL